MPATPPEEPTDIIEELAREVLAEERAAGVPILPARRGLAAARKRLEKLDRTGTLAFPEETGNE